MKYLETYLKKIEDRGNYKLAKSISKTADDIGKKYLETFSFTTHETGLLLGNIQSGKTGQMFGIMCKAADLGFPVFIILTTDNVTLQNQTLDRVKNDLEGFCICGENDAGIFTDNNLIQPVVIVLKKNFRVLKLWSNILSSTGFMKGNPLFIIDDEADAASLNTLVNKKRQSSINKYLTSIKDDSSSSIYLQVTGTPQALFLQTMSSGWHPYFTYYFQPGDTYLGGDFFFPAQNIPKCIAFLDTIIEPFKEVVLRHLAVSSQLLLSGEKVSNCLFHPSVRISIHELYANKIKKELQWCRDNVNSDFKMRLKEKYMELTPQKSIKLSFDKIFLKSKELLENKAKILIMNGKHEVPSENYAEGCNFIIGGNTLGRGVTFPALQTIFYTRTSKKPQADTMWQHSRMFGYDRDPGLMMVYISENLYKLFSDINSTNNAIISQIEKGIDSIKVYYPDGLNPTRKNVLDNKHVITISGGTNYYPFYPDNDDINKISNLLIDFSESTPFYYVNMLFIKKILTHIIPSPDFNLKAFLSILDTLRSKNPTIQGILIVRRNRDITQGTGALLSPNDWELGRSFPKHVVLTMYQVTGNKGWNNKHLWIPNIKLPDDIMYYDVIEEM